MTADVHQAVHRLRALSAEMSGTPEAERDARVKGEVQAMLKGVDADDRNVFLDGLLDAFPVWPPDIEPPPPPAPPTDEEMAQALADKAMSSDGERIRIANLLRAKGIGGGLSESQTAELRRFFNLPGTAQPDLNRMIEILRTLAKAVDDIERASRDFLKQNGVVFAIGASPRIAETIAKLLPMGDTEGARHARNTEMDNARNVLLLGVHVLRAFCPKYAEELAEKYAPANIESTQSGFGKAGKSWEEFINRLGGQRDKGGVRAEFESQMSRKIQQLVREIQ